MKAMVERFLSAPLQQQFFLLLALLGIVQFVRAAVRIQRTIWAVFMRRGKNLSSYGEWALVTGATDGIGRAFCFQLAKKGINLFIVGRTESKLRDLVRELEEAHKISVKYAVMDFASEDLGAGLGSLAKAIEGLEIGILINNVGVSYPYAKFVHEVDEELVRSLVNVNIMATTRVTQVVLPDMVRRRKGAVVNVGSGSGSILPADPLYSIYAATKGYVEVLSRSMHEEYKHLGIDVQCQAPLLVRTKMAKIRRESLTVPSPDLYAKWGLRSIGYEPVLTPYWTHHLLWLLIGLVPERVVNAVRFKSNLDVRKRGMAKATKAI